MRQIRSSAATRGGFCGEWECVPGLPCSIRRLGSMRERASCRAARMVAGSYRPTVYERHTVRWWCLAQARAQSLGHINCLRVSATGRFWQCYTHKAACLGGSAADNAEGVQTDAVPSRCREGHSGPVCAVCLNGWAMVHANCKQCVGDAWEAIGSAGVVAMVLVGSVLLIFRFRRKLGITKRLSSVKIIVGFYSLLAVLEQTFAIAWPAGKNSLRRPIVCHSN